MRATTRLLGAWLSTMALGCNLDKAPVGPRGPAFDESLAPAAPLVVHVIAPQATDPAIDRFLDDHYVWLDTTARTNHKLFVFLPGTVVGSATPQRPAQFQLVQQEAARLGYHVIGLMYVNSGGIAQACPTDPDPAACYENARLEVHGRNRPQSHPGRERGEQYRQPSHEAARVPGRSIPRRRLVPLPRTRQAEVVADRHQWAFGRRRIRGHDREGPGRGARGAVRRGDGQHRYPIGSMGYDPPDTVGPLLRTRA